MINCHLIGRVTFVLHVHLKSAANWYNNSCFLMYFGFDLIQIQTLENLVESVELPNPHPTLIWFVIVFK
jgi:hypothetical protein